MPDTLSTIINNFLFFYAFTFLRTRVVARQALQSNAKGPVVLSAIQEVAIGCAAGLFSKFIVTPLSNITVRAQTEKRRSVAKGKKAAKKIDSDSDDSDDEFSGEVGLMEIARTIHAERGITGFWSGFQSSILLVRQLRNPLCSFFEPNFLLSCPLVAADDQSSDHHVLLRPPQADYNPDAASSSSDPSPNLPRRRTRFLDVVLHHLPTHPFEDSPPVSLPLERSTSLFEHFRRHFEDGATGGSQRTVSRFAVDAVEGIHRTRIVVDDQGEVRLFPLEWISR